MDNRYCVDKCSIGKAAREVFLSQCNSPFDAAFDFMYFTDNCLKTCPYKNNLSEHLKQVRSK